MTADAADGPPGPAGHAGPRLGPRDIRERLTPETAGEFDRQWRATMARAVEALDLAEVLQLLAGWERVAVMTERLGPEGYRAFLADVQSRSGDRGGPGTTVVRFGVDEANALIRAR